MLSGKKPPEKAEIPINTPTKTAILHFTNFLRPNTSMAKRAKVKSINCPVAAVMCISILATTFESTRGVILDYTPQPHQTYSSPHSQLHPKTVKLHHKGVPTFSYHRSYLAYWFKI
ncbi:hypothetical protein ES705_11367 [subsurface metagenome]